MSGLYLPCRLCCPNPKTHPVHKGPRWDFFHRLLARGADCNGLLWSNYSKFIAIKRRKGTLITLLVWSLVWGDIQTKPAIIVGLQEAPSRHLETQGTKEDFRVRSVFCMWRELTTERRRVQTHLPKISVLTEVNDATQLMSYSSFIHFEVIKSTKVHQSWKSSKSRFNRFFILFASLVVSAFPDVCVHILTKERQQLKLSILE